MSILCLCTVWVRVNTKMNKLLKQLHRQGQIWPAAQVQNIVETVDSGYQELNHNLHGGFPRQGLIEVQSLSGIGELRLFLPYLLNLLKIEEQEQQKARKMVFIAPPAQVNAAMFLQACIPLENLLVISSEKSAESLWAAEQCLKSGCCFAVLLWQQLLAVHQVKRLKQAALIGSAVQVIFRSPLSIDLALPVSLSLGLEPQPCGLKVSVKKQLGGWPCVPFLLNMHQQWPSLTEPPMLNNVVPLSGVKVG